MKSHSAEMEETIALLEQEMWRDGIDLDLLGRYQRLCREREHAIARQGKDDRHEFLIVIPVADRPQHLAECLESLLTLCRTYEYGGCVQGRYPKVAVLIADDSGDLANIAQNRAIAAGFTRQGLETLYFGLAEQTELLRRLTAADSDRLAPIIGDTRQGALPHKGASITRNIAYLKLRELTRKDRRQLFYFIDSDQEFRVRVETPEGEQDLFAINYFHHLDALFSQREISLLTGKVVGDPPVSPAVMAGNFLTDVIAFLSRMAELEPDQSCRFHAGDRAPADEAAYHDMADLFGFKGARDAFPYRCTLDGGHDHVACFKAFARKLGHFFDGAHPTRKSHYQYKDPAASLSPARTVYTGNYIFRPGCLDYFIPFAPLKLRMAGPVLGRILKAELKERFVSANLPMLHKRTLRQTGQSEFRPGVCRTREVCDISCELERQFHGDLMLFAMEELTAQGYPSCPLTPTGIGPLLQETAETLHRKYLAKQALIGEGLTRLQALFDASRDGGEGRELGAASFDEQNWWNHRADLAEARGQFAAFIGNIERNFGSGAEGYALIGPGPNREQRLQAIAGAIFGYAGDRAAWESRDLG
ncbi:MAG: hypothetical protein A2514_08340 [Gammaproteobacteria bacterium RIFOXYD12_FULL_61_37]|nr:MAG: hypothetical protein A2514_08340 [Gammaproteobacteria bacterium RIFOXYD12_FULL_61_37]